MSQDGMCWNRAIPLLMPEGGLEFGPLGLTGLRVSQMALGFISPGNAFGQFDVSPYYGLPLAERRW